MSNLNQLSITNIHCSQFSYTELAANLFRATQAEEKLRRDEVQGKTNANRTRYEVGKKVRETIENLGGTMPEDLPTPDRSVKAVEGKKKKLGGWE